MATDYKDFYIKDPKHNKFNDTKFIEDDIINIIVQKYLILIYTNKGEVLGAEEMGLDLVDLLVNTNTDASLIQMDIYEQIARYIPEIQQLPYSVQVKFVEDDTKLFDLMLIYFKISDYEVFNVISK
jgi:hypothetical protein